MSDSDAQRMERARVRADRVQRLYQLTDQLGTKFDVDPESIGIDPNGDTVTVPADMLAVLLEAAGVA